MGERVLAGSCAGAFYGVDRTTGKVAWRHTTASDGGIAQFHGDAWVTDEAVVVGAHGRYRGFLYAFEPADGRLLWKLELPEGVAVQVHGEDDAALAVTLGGEVLAAEVASGTIRWRGRGPDGATTYYTGDPVLEQGRLFVPWSSGVLDAWDAATGALVWRRDLGTTLNTSLALFEGEVVVGTLDGRVLRLDPGSGELLGAFDPGSPGGVVLGDLVVGRGCLIALLAAGTAEGSPLPVGPYSVACLRPAAGEVSWQRSSDAAWTSLRPLVRDRQVVVGTGGRLRGLGLAKGEVLWDLETAGTPRGLGASGGTLYVGTREGSLLSLPWPR